MTRDEFVPVIAYLSAASNKPMPRAQAEVYFDLLGDLPATAVLAATKQAVLDGDGWIPPVGKLRSAALALVRPPELTWGEAWEQACAAARRFGWDRPSEGLDSLPPAVARAAHCVGWRQLCDARVDDMDTLRAQFRDVFKPLAERERRAELLPPSVRQAVASIGSTAGIRLLTEDPRSA
jgi:hypothetical protein